MRAIQKIFSKFYSKAKELFNPTGQQVKAANNILKCKTPAMGGNIHECDECHNRVIHYNSCRNRHCPCCQAIEKEVWADKQLENVVNAPYFHLVFTIPEQLRLIVFHNQKLLYNLMYKAVNETLTLLAMDKKYLGAQIGFFCVLHTWGDDLRYHPHLHVVVMAGGLTKHNQWRSSSKKFFIPVKVLSKVFRGKFLYYLKYYYNQGELNFYGETEEYISPDIFKGLINTCCNINWYTYSKKTFSGPAALVRYLARYTHRIAISNHRITAIDDGNVTFARKNKEDGKTITLSGVEFTRRFLMHVLPKGFVKIRSYGLLANRNKKTKLALCRKLTNSSKYKSVYEGMTITEILSFVMGRNMSVCPFCQAGKMSKIGYLLPATT